MITVTSFQSYSYKNEKYTIVYLSNGFSCEIRRNDKKEFYLVEAGNRYPAMQYEKNEVILGKTKEQAKEALIKLFDKF